MNRTLASEGKTFRELCCSRLTIPAEAFEETVLLACLPPNHLRIGKWRWRLTRSYFDFDIKLIQTVAGCTNMSDLCSELTDYHDQHQDFGLQRNFLRARLSGQLLVNFAAGFLPAN